MWPFNTIRNLRRKVSYLNSVVEEQRAELRLCQARPYFTEISRDLEPQVARVITSRAVDMLADRLALVWEPLLSDAVLDALRQLLSMCRDGDKCRVPRNDPRVAAAHPDGVTDTVHLRIVVPSVAVEAELYVK